MPFFTVSLAQPPDALQSLTSKAQNQGRVRVIVGLKVGFKPVGDLARPQDVQRQQRTISGVQNSVLQKMMNSKARLIAQFKYIPYMALEVDADAVTKLAALPEVISIEEDKPVPPTLASSIPVIGADDAWASGFTGVGQTIAILDTGVDKAHSFFTTTDDKVVSEACYSTNEETFSGATSFCPGGLEETTTTGSGVHCPTSITGCDHGTHVAGIAIGNNGGVNFGVAKDANIITIQVFTKIDDDLGTLNICANNGLSSPCILTSSIDQIKGLERVFELRNDFDIAAVNMSLGSGQFFAACDSNSRKAAIDNLRSVGIATVISAGNSGFKDSMGAPACISTAISVGATEDDDDVASFSNIASFISLLAPGVSIISSVPGNGISNFDGTSMAAPHVAGAWAVVKQRAPNATVDEILTAFQNTGTLVDDQRAGGSATDMARIDLDQALLQFPANLEITKLATPDPVFIGELLTYTIIITNNGPAIAPNVLITGTVPTSTTLNVASLSADGSASGGLITWTTGITLGIADTLSRTFIVTVVDSHNAPWQIVNTAHVSSTTALNVESDTVTADVEIPQSDLKIDKAARDTVRGGQALTYTITISNEIDITAPNVIITDTVPASTTLIPASLSPDATYAGVSAGSVITWQTGISLTQNQSLSRTLVVSVTEGLTSGQIINVAYVSADNIGAVSSSAMTTTITNIGDYQIYLPAILK